MTTSVERSLVLVKPDGVRRGKCGEIIRRIEARGFVLAAVELRTAPRDLLEEHYSEHHGKPFFEPLVEYMGAEPVLAIVIEGEDCISSFRVMAGATKPAEAAAGTIRGDLGRSWDAPVLENLVHGSDSPESAAREIKLWFPNLG